MKQLKIINNPIFLRQFLFIRNPISIIINQFQVKRRQRVNIIILINKQHFLHKLMCKIKSLQKIFLLLILNSLPSFTCNFFNIRHSKCKFFILLQALINIILIINNNLRIIQICRQFLHNIIRSLRNILFLLISILIRQITNIFRVMFLKNSI